MNNKTSSNNVPQTTPPLVNTNAASSTLAPTEIDKKFDNKKPKKDKGKENGRIKSFRYTVLNSAGKKKEVL